MDRAAQSWRHGDGAGVHIKVAQVVAAEGPAALRNSADDKPIRARCPTLGDGGIFRVGSERMAAQAATRTIRQRLIDHVCQRIVSGRRKWCSRMGTCAGAQSIPFAKVAHSAYMAESRCPPLASIATPKIHWDKTRTRPALLLFRVRRSRFRSRARHAYRRTRFLRVDIVSRRRNVLNPAIDLGQIEGGFLQGAGWLTSESCTGTRNASCRRTHPPRTRFPRERLARAGPHRAAVCLAEPRADFYRSRPSVSRP